MGQEYISKKVVKLLKDIGYEHRIENYYVIQEKDGYIIVNYWNDYGVEYIEFHKIFTESQYPNSSHLTHRFGHYLDFERFMGKYHVKEMRKIKLNKLDD